MWGLSSLVAKTVDHIFVVSFKLSMQGYRATVPGRIGQTVHEVAEMHGVSQTLPINNLHSLFVGLEGDLFASYE